MGGGLEQLIKYSRDPVVGKDSRFSWRARPSALTSTPPAGVEVAMETCIRLPASLLDVPPLGAALDGCPSISRTQPFSLLFDLVGATEHQVVAKETTIFQC